MQSESGGGIPQKVTAFLVQKLLVKPDGRDLLVEGECLSVEENGLLREFDFCFREQQESAEISGWFAAVQESYPGVRTPLEFYVKVGRPAIPVCARAISSLLCCTIVICVLNRSNDYFEQQVIGERGAGRQEINILSHHGCHFEWLAPFPFSG